MIKTLPPIALIIKTTTVWIFQATTEQHLHEKTWTWVKKKGNFKRETEFLLIAAQNNATITNYVKAKEDKM